MGRRGVLEMRQGRILDESVKDWNQVSNGNRERIVEFLVKFILALMRVL